MIDAAAIAPLLFFRDMSPAALRALASRAVERRFAAGEVLFTARSAARGLFIVVEGRVRVVRAAEGRQHVVHSEGPGGTLGEVPLFAGGGYPATAIAAEPTRCLVFTREAIGEAIAADSDVAWTVLAHLARRVRALVDRLDRLAALPVTARLAAWLLARGAACDGRAFSLGLTQGELAEELGTVREVVVRSLRALRAAGAIRSLGRGRVEIVDEGALRRLAGRATVGP